ncbi:MAG: ATP-binding protein [Deltaproteobacteria bacterium]|jgi:Mg-chelatase subunit ChlI|nr:ATP-binding protein [Deltaproteobacteria bacterium]MBW2531880.1 ATP-binding protein [Deltaproteobacteria bacterium]
MPSRPEFPFSAFVGQEPMRIALVVNAVDPTVGGVLIRGHKGTGKSTAVRSLAELLPPLRVVDGCPYRCDPAAPSPLHDECAERLRRGESLPSKTIPMPLCELPLNATEDRLVGSLQVEHALRTGERRFEPGLLAAANRGVLYVDEVNLLEDHLVDLVLDAAAAGVNTVEREGMSVQHPAELLLVGTMNPEEGELRPQFLDRFGLCVIVRGLESVDDRELLVHRRFEYEADPAGFRARWAESERALAQAIAQARAALAEVPVSAANVRRAVQLAAEARTHGHRAELTTVKAARALAALAGKKAISDVEIADAARYALPHRIKDQLRTTPEACSERVDQLVTEALGERPTSMFPPPIVAEVDDEQLAEAMQVPGAAAAGSILLSSEKKTPSQGATEPTE